MLSTVVDEENDPHMPEEIGKTTNKKGEGRCKLCTTIGFFDKEPLEMKFWVAIQSRICLIHH